MHHFPSCFLYFRTQPETILKDFDKTIVSLSIKSLRMNRGEKRNRAVYIFTNLQATVIEKPHSKCLLIDPRHKFISR